MASTYLTKVAPAAGNRTKGTISMWVKRGSLGSTEYLYTEYLNSTDHGVVYFSGANGLNIKSVNGNSAEMQLSTNRVFRDINAWYHLVFAWDTSQGTAADRVKMYVNGVQETSFSTATYPSQSSNLKFGIGSPSGNNYNIYIGRKGSASDYFTGSMSHFHRVDNQQLTPSTFGSTDSTTGEWKINTSPSITYTGSSSHNFFILKDGNSVTDQSGEGNNLTVGSGTLTKTEDCPSNVFATLNSLVRVAGNITYSSGNTKIARSGSAEWRTCYSTLAMTTGKYYFEALSDAGANNVIGIRELQNADGSTAGSGNDYPGYTSQGWSLYNQNGTVYNNNATSGSAIGTFTDGDYIGVFLDCDNQKLYFSKNGTMLNTTGYSISAVPYVFGVALYDDGGGFSCNFGNGAFGSTQLTGTTYNGSDGNGIFKYDPNSITLDGSSKSFKSLSTKGLNS